MATPHAIAWLALGLPEWLILLILLGFMALTVWMLVDCAIKEPTIGVMVAWMVVIAVLGIIGALVYLFVRKIPRQARRPVPPAAPPPPGGAGQ